MGWSSRLSIRRTRVTGTIDYATDDLTSPWGTLTLGNDGAYYPRGLQTPVRLDLRGNEWTATTADGVQFLFHAADTMTTSRGTFEWHLSEVVSSIGDRTQID